MTPNSTIKRLCLLTDILKFIIQCLWQINALLNAAFLLQEIDTLYALSRILTVTPHQVLVNECMSQSFEYLTALI